MSIIGLDMKILSFGWPKQVQIMIKNVPPSNLPEVSSLRRTHDQS